MNIASSEAQPTGRDVPISDPMSESDPRLYWGMFRGHIDTDFHEPHFPQPFHPTFGPHGFNSMHGGPFYPPTAPRSDPRQDSRPDPRPDPRMYNCPPSPPPFGWFDPRFMHGMHDFWGPRRFGDYHHDTPRFRPPHPCRPFPPRSFGPYGRNWWQNAWACPWMRRLGETSDDKKDFKVTLNVSQFAPEDLNVTVIDGHVKIHGKHEEREDQQGYIAREFVRRFQLPGDVDPETVKSSLGPGGLLTVFAPIKSKNSDNSEALEVPIEIDAKSPTPEADCGDK